jgi:hypothetical protein
MSWYENDKDTEAVALQAHIAAVAEELRHPLRREKILIPRNMSA